MSSPINSNPKLSGFAYICQKLSEFGNWLGRGIRWIKNKCCCCCVKRVDDAARGAMPTPVTSTKLSSVPPNRSNPTGNPAGPQAERKEAAAAEITDAHIAAGTSLQINGITITVKGFQNPFTERFDVIVNAANDQFESGGAGTNQIMTQLAGESPFQEAQAQLKAMYERDAKFAWSDQRAKPGTAILTPAGNMQNARFLIQALAPDLTDSNIPRKPGLYGGITDEAMQDLKTELKAAYFNSLMRVREKNEELHKDGAPLIKSILLPSLGTGAYRWDVGEAAPVAMQAFQEFAEQYPNSGLTNITLSIYTGPKARNTEQEYRAYSTALEEIGAEYEKAQKEMIASSSSSSSTKTTPPTNNNSAQSTTNPAQGITVGEMRAMEGENRISRSDTLEANYDGSMVQTSGHSVAMGTPSAITTTTTQDDSLQV